MHNIDVVGEGAGNITPASKHMRTSIATAHTLPSLLCYPLLPSLPSLPSLAPILPQALLEAAEHETAAAYLTNKCRSSHVALQQSVRQLSNDSKSSPIAVHRERQRLAEATQRLQAIEASQAAVNAETGWAREGAAHGVERSEMHIEAHVRHILNAQRAGRMEGGRRAVAAALRTHGRELRPATPEAVRAARLALHDPSLDDVESNYSVF